MEESQFTLKLLESERMLYRISCALLRSDADRQDAMQQCAMKAWEYRMRLREERYFKTWIARIMVNECHEICRKNRRVVIAEKIPDCPAPESHELEIRLMLESLPEKQRVPMVLHYLEGFSLEEIAQVQRVSVAMVKYRMHQARKTLRVEWNGEEG
ncbi:MAG: RNA polymerase sigma factor [Clostridia bacterium]|nr:RNA polymerase sigma factor [Clostridia bacterium]